MANTVTNILKVLLTHFVSVIRHQHRCTKDYPRLIYILVILGNEIHSESETFVYVEEQKNGHNEEIIEEKIESSVKTEKEIQKGSCHKNDHKSQSHMMHGNNDRDQIVERCRQGEDYITYVDGLQIGMFSSNNCEKNSLRL